MMKLLHMHFVLPACALFFCLVPGKAIYAQNMVFNRVILMVKNSTDTVPANHIWKIVNFTSEGEIMGGTASRPMRADFNGVANYLSFNTRDGNGSQYNRGGGATPFWLPENTVLFIPDAGSGIESVSIIEFTVVP